MRWRKSSYSQGNGDCVELGEADGAVHVRNSNHPDRGTLALPTAAVGAFVRACATGEYDDLTS
jgi:hypothetical protein